MRSPIIVRPFSDEEREQIVAGLHSSDAFTLRRCQILLASARGEAPPRIAHALSCHEQTVRNAIHAFNLQGLAALARQSRRPHSLPRAIFDAAHFAQLWDMLHRSPRDLGYSAPGWTLELAAKAAYEREITPRRVRGETIRAALAQRGVPWQRVKHWATKREPESVSTRGSPIL